MNYVHIRAQDMAATVAIADDSLFSKPEQR